MRHPLLPRAVPPTHNPHATCDRLKEQESTMKVLLGALVAAGLLSGCISSSSPPPPQKTTVVVPPGSTTTVVCQNGNPPPCD